MTDLRVNRELWFWTNNVLPATLMKNVFKVIWTLKMLSKRSLGVFLHNVERTTLWER